MPQYRDYHRTVVGFHGTLRETALAIVTGERSFKHSKNADDWLGHGVYFWEYAPRQAWKWAAQRYKKSKKPVAVLGTMIRLGHCFDLLDPINVESLKKLHEQMKKDLERNGSSIPKNFNAKKKLDCATFQYAYAALEEENEPVDTCRAVYVPTQGKDRLWDRSWLYHETHIQLCVRKPESILGCWLVEPED